MKLTGENGINSSRKNGAFNLVDGKNRGAGTDGVGEGVNGVEETRGGKVPRDRYMAGGDRWVFVLGVTVMTLPVKPCIAVFLWYGF